MFIRNWRVRTKILGGMSAVLVLMLAVSASFFMLLINASNTGAAAVASASRAEETLLRTSVEIMSMRRLTGMIHAYNGNEERINGYKSDFEASYAAANGYLASLAASAASADTMTDAEKANVAASTAAVQDLLHQYKTQLFDVNVESAKRSDTEALAASNARYGSLITSVSESVHSLLEDAKASKEAGIAASLSSVDSLLTAFITTLAIITPLAFLLALYIARTMYKPLEVLIGFMKKAGESGDITPRAEDIENIRRYGAANDEIGQTIGSTSAFILRVNDVSKVLHAISDGDLTAVIKPLSEKDELGLSLQKLTRSLNTMFAEINESSSQVSSGSRQVSERTRDNSLKTKQAAKLANLIKGSAENGSGQMDDMIQSVRAIDEATAVLRELISQFKLREDETFAALSLPPRARRAPMEPEYAELVGADGEIEISLA